MKAKALGAIELSQIFPCMLHSHPLLDLVESMKREWREDSRCIRLIERIITDVLMMRLAAISTLRRTGGGEELTELCQYSRIRLLTLHIACISAVMRSSYIQREGSESMQQQHT